MTRLLGLVALVVAGVGLAPAPASAAYCSSSGVHVLVDFGKLGGGEQKGCLPTDSRVTGDRAFTGAGFPLTSAKKWREAVCRVQGKPASSPCVEMPPANAFWGLFHTNGGRWQFSNSGVFGLRLNPGDSVAFVWQDGGGMNRPRSAAGPSTFPTPKPPKPAKPPKADKPAKPKPTKGPQGSSPKSPQKSSPGATASASATTGPSASATASGGPSATPSSTASSSPSGDSTAAAAPPESLTPRGEPAEEGLPGWVPIGLVVGLSGAAAAAVAIRRRWA